ncbi:MAG: site-specific integrase [Gemmataceae bacterium]
MARSRNPVPSYLPHKQRGKARAVWTDSAGVRQYRLLPGAYNSKESKEAFARLQLELAAAAPAAASESGAVSELFLAFLIHAEKHYRRADGSQTSELHEFKSLIRIVRPLYGDSPVSEFGPLALKAVRELLVAKGLCRSLINQRIGRLKRIFRWGVAEELVPETVYRALDAVAGLQAGRCDAPEAKPIGPVHESVVEATLPFLNRYVRGLVEFQRLTGCRPGEACLLRRCDIDTGGAVWIYTPHQHKTAWRGKSRTIAIGPQAQAAIRPFFTTNIGDYLFSPVRMMRELRDRQRKEGRLPTAKAKPKKKPGEHYTSRSYAEAVGRACEKAGVEHWHPNQLRHAYATKIRKEHGLEAAQVLLGHARADVTQIYAEKNQELAATVAAKIG